MHIWPSDSIVELWSFKLFIILKKNNSHLSFLHCYHHFFMAFGMYMATLWIPGGHGTMLGMVNTFVHAFMYFYFFLTAFKPELKRSIWWKKHITQFQMVRTFKLWVSNFQFLPFQCQFAFLIVHFLRGALAKNCSYPKFWMWTLVIQNTFMFTLFADFYYKAYLKKNQK